MRPPTYDDHALLTVSASDPLGHTTTAEHDYRLLAPWQVTDANGNRTQVAFDILGFVTASAVMGKVGDSDGDTLEDPTSTFEYDLFAWQTTGKPNWARSLVRETHQDPSTRWLEQRSYFSGAGAVVMVKAQARPGLAPQRDENGVLIMDEHELVLADTAPNLRWIGNGRTIKDNKGNVVKAYEPYFSSTPEYEDEAELVEQGVSPLMHYDPLGRLIRTDFPNGTFSRVEFTPWEQTSYDPNDTVLTSEWYTQRIDYAGSDVALLKEKRAAQQSAAHANTPSKVVLDSLGRPFLALAQLEVDVFLATKSVLDIQGRVLQVIDARGNTAESRTYGMLGQSLEVLSHDAGDRTNLLNALGQPMRSWDDRNQRHSVSYDTLRRPVDRTVSVAGGAEKLLSRIIYGDDLANPTTTNHAGRVYRCYDGAGVATTLAYDFKGHPLEEQRQFVAQKTAQADWSILFGEDTIADMATAAASLLDAETFSASSERDALGRVLTAVSPDGSEVHYHYDEGGALQRVTLHHRGSTTEQTPVGEITYDAKGRRESITHGPLASPTSTTSYTYDALSQRLTRLRTVRASDDEAIQSLHYHYDAVGNITDIRDTAQQTVYFQNSVVEAANSYTYDGLYRLVEATGREHASEGTTQRTHADLTATPQPMTSDPSAMRRYTQQYVYDEVGNILEMRHIPATGTGWTRYYEYDESGNRLLATSAPGDDPEGPYSHEYPYDAHGNMTAMPHLSSMVWNHDDELVSAVAGTETVYFQYAGGNRARKYTEKSGSTTEERIYLGGFEIYRKRVSGSVDVERESLHVSDDTGRILLIETKTTDAGSPITTPTGIWRYQISNHLGSAATELTEDGDIISYEEYYPYGTTAYRAVDSSIDVSAKRYRYTGMERDEETGLSYHTARYYASWLGRWTACDPIGLAGGEERYGYAGGAPIGHRDLAGMSPMDAAHREVVAARRAMETARPEDREAATNAYIRAEESRNRVAAEERVRARKAVATAEKAVEAYLAEAKDAVGDATDPLTDTEINEWWTPQKEERFRAGLVDHYEQSLREIDAQDKTRYLRVVNNVGFYPIGRMEGLFPSNSRQYSEGRQLVSNLDDRLLLIQNRLEGASPAQRIRAMHGEYATRMQRLPSPLLDQAVGMHAAKEMFALSIIPGAARAQAEASTAPRVGSSYGSQSVGAAHRNLGKVIQTGGRTIEKKTSDALNDATGSDLTPREWGRGFELLKKENNLRNDHHGKITEFGY